LVSPNNHEELARNIVLLLEDDSFAKKLGKRARETVIQRFSASQMASKTLDVYRRCIDGGTEV
jgi:glycosyltransferase involved in cell wall biosynthesis